MKEPRALDIAALTAVADNAGFEILRMEAFLTGHLSEGRFQITGTEQSFDLTETSAAGPETSTKVRVKVHDFNSQKPKLEILPNATPTES